MQIFNDVDAIHCDEKSDPRVALKEHLPSGKLTISMAIFNGKSTINGHFQ
jgi:hypothetical protein